MCPARRLLGVKRGKPNGSLGSDVPDKEALDWLSCATSMAGFFGVTSTART
jgi:hypothetical protein